MTNVDYRSGGGGGGMPKWLLILLVILIVVILGCCGGLTACFFLARHAVRTAAPVMQARIEAAEKQAAEAQQRAEAAAAAGGANMTPPAAGDNGVAPTPAAGAAPDTPAAIGPAQKLPASFPKDVPIEPGMTPTFSLGDNTKGNGTVMLSGNVKADDAAAYYIKELEKNGWTQTSNAAINNSTILQYSKNDLKLTVQVVGAQGNEATMVNLAYEKQQP